MEAILSLFPDPFKKVIQEEIKTRWDELQEIRMRLEQPIELIFNDRSAWLSSCKPNKNDFIFIINQLSEHSLYRMENELREGYMTIEGGHRVGLAGKVTTEKGRVKAIQYITFLNIRIAKEKIGAAVPIIPYIYHHGYVNTLIIGPPQTGKTTLIRDIARIVSSGRKGVPGKKVGIIDERSEIAASIKGVPQHNLGPRTDVMDACPKAEGMMMMIRSMSPDMLVVDEIGGKKDVEALLEAINAGVTVICTIHGKSVDELKKRPVLQHVFEQKIFQRFVLLNKAQKPGSIQRIYDKEENLLRSGCLPDAVDWSTSFRRDNHLGRV
ncbi:stage III sporulation protein AA [Virgibacillus kimchii]